MLQRVLSGPVLGALRAGPACAPAGTAHPAALQLLLQARQLSTSASEGQGQQAQGQLQQQGGGEQGATAQEGKTGDADSAAEAAAAEEERQRQWDEEEDSERLTTGPDVQGDMELPSTWEIMGGAAASGGYAAACPDAFFDPAAHSHSKPEPELPELRISLDIAY